MSSTLKWRPVVPVKGHECDALKFLLRDCNNGDTIHNMLMEAKDIGLLRGIIFATTSEEIKDEAAALIEAIKKHGSIELWEEF